VNNRGKIKMTVNELFKVWLYCKNPRATLMVWDRSEGDYIFISNPPLPNQDVEKISQMEVKCFYETKGMKPNLIVNVGEYE
jgi:hypothetical protein